MLKNDQICLLEPGEVAAKAIVNYYKRNKEFLREYEPERAAEFYDLDYQERLLEREKKEVKNRMAFHFYIAEKAAPDRVIGMVRLTNVIWGNFRSAFLGYKLDKDCLNRGYMTMAVTMVTNYVFSEFDLHRIEANIMPRNKRSLRVAEKCGFREEGVAQKYLKINGVWEDHVHMVRLNED